MKAILGIKKGMTRVFDGEKAVPVTIIDVEGCKIANIRDGEVELALGKKKGKKSLEGQYKELGFVPRYTKVFKIEPTEDMKIGSDVKGEIFEKGESVSLSGISKGKGFAGVVKRWGFGGGPRTHGQSDRLRAPGSIGAGADPGRVFKGKKMAGRMGGKKITLKNKKVVDVKDTFILIGGPVPGSNGSLVVVFSK
ncbi:MAG: 50S ribosomal protein L3 [Candidatus Dojkabacteria bacterium]|jgi:large subunit ribosomal protein L3